MKEHVWLHLPNLNLWLFLNQSCQCLSSVPDVCLPNPFLALSRAFGRITQASSAACLMIFTEPGHMNSQSVISWPGPGWLSSGPGELVLSLVCSPLAGPVLLCGAEATRLACRLPGRTFPLRDDQRWSWLLALSRRFNQTSHFLPPWYMKSWSAEFYLRDKSDPEQTWSSKCWLIL